MQLQEKEEYKEGKYIGKLIRKHPDKKGAYQPYTYSHVNHN